MTQLRTLSAAGCLALLMIPISVEYLDRPVARLFFEVFGDAAIIREFSRTPSFFGPLEILVAAIFILRRIARCELAYPDSVLAQCEIGLLAAKALLSPLKLTFGRTWPLYGHPSYLVDGAYGFNFFTAGSQYQSFPSGHAASVCAMFGVLWITYPDFKSIYLAGAAVTAIALVAGNFHFVSDVVAGVLLGGSVAATVAALWRCATHKLASMIG